MCGIGQSLTNPSIPGALGMCGLAIAVSSIGETLPEAVFALLSGLNAATVGIIALAAVQLAGNTITDKLTRVLVFLGAAAGMLYNSLWYLPLIMTLAGLSAVIHDFKWLHGPIRTVAGALRFRRRRQNDGESGLNGHEMTDSQTARHEETTGFRVVSAPSTAALATRERVTLPDSIEERLPVATEEPMQDRRPASREVEPRVIPTERRINISWQSGLTVIGVFLATFTAVMVVRAALLNRPLLYNFFANMYLAGTIIFGGGPVVIPLLREYVVAEGWVSARDFLIGLALIQGFPGPNFNIAVYLGTLTAINSGRNPALGAVLGFVGIFVPGLALVHGTMGVWGAIRGRRWVVSGLRGVNAAAVGLIYTAVYRLWQIGWIDADFEQGTSLANDPWWVVVTATSFVGGRWFGISPPVAIILGAVMGLVRYGVVSASS